jgi:hypothetical protein
MYPKGMRRYTVNKRDYQVIDRRLNGMRDTKWKQLGDRHFSLVPSLFKLAEKDDRLYFTILLHLNCVFEGGLKLLGERKGLSSNQMKTLDKIIDGLHAVLHVITDGVEKRLRAYKDEYRNKYTHEVFRTPGRKEAIDGVTETYFLILVLMSLYSFSGTISDQELDRAIIQSFCESLSLNINMRDLFSRRGGYIFPIGIDEVRGKLLTAHHDSIFSRIFSLRLVETWGLGYPFELGFIDPEGRTGSKWRLRVQKLPDYPSGSLEPHRADLGQSNVFYVLFRFTRRSRVETYMQELASLGIPHFVLDVLRVNQRIVAERMAAKDYLLLDNWIH